MRHNKPKTMQELAAHLADLGPQSLRGIISDDFLRKSPTLESWRQPLAVFFPPQVMDAEFKIFMTNPPRVEPSILSQYLDYLEFFTSARNCFEESRPHQTSKREFDPENVPVHIAQVQRMTNGDAIAALGLLKENPQMLLMIASLQSFYANYMRKLRTATKTAWQKNGERPFPFFANVFDRFDNTLSTNPALFGGVMALQFMLAHEHFAKKESRFVGVITDKDFEHFANHAHPQKMFFSTHEIPEGKICPFSPHLRRVANEVCDGVGGPRIGAGLLAIYKKVALVATAQEQTLKPRLAAIYAAAKENFDSGSPNSGSPVAKCPCNAALG